MITLFSIAVCSIAAYLYGRYGVDYDDFYLDLHRPDIRLNNAERNVTVERGKRLALECKLMDNYIEDQLECWQLEGV